jgi:outer membrane protein assembly factor BamB
MNEQTAVLDQVQTPVPMHSAWRRWVVLFTLLGAAGFIFGRIAAHGFFTVSPTVVMMTTMSSPMLALLGFGLWWCLFGDFGRVRRITLALAAVVASIAVVLAAEGQFAPPEGMKMFALMWGVPLTAAITGLVAAAVPAVHGWPLAIVAVVAVSPWLVLRNEGVYGKFELDTSLRWKPSRTQAAEQQLASDATVLSAHPSPLVVADASDWPGFRGVNRDGVVPEAAFHGWDGSPPKQRWRKNPVGTAWSSFCAAGDYVFTQEQRGDSESVVCYRADTGEQVWARGEPGRHTDWASGSGPRATPTLADGKLFVATTGGVVLALRAESGEPIWKVNLQDRFGFTKPQFGLATSPLVIGDVVFVNPASPNSPRLVALSAANGETRWQTEGKGTDGYSSPQAATIDGVAQILVFNGAGLFGHDPATGKELWRHDWVVRITDPSTVQPLVLPDGRVVFGGGNRGLGTRCVEVHRNGAEWTVTPKWQTKEFTPIFNDVVRFGGNLFGLDTGRLVCLDLSNGNVRWKEGDFGSGQLLLVGNRILIATENGKLACVAANADDLEELWRVDVVKGKTWNHPAIARGRLFYRNTTEMVVFDLPGWKAKD